MKKIISLTLVFVFVFALGICAAAQTAAPDYITVNVTIADADGKLALADEAIRVTDKNGNGAFDIDDALYAAHEAKYQGGASAGYASSVGAYGLAIDKLWGTANGGSYGYYVNNASAMGLGDTLSDGDYVCAYVITDSVAWSDTYCYFNTRKTTVEYGAELELTLTMATYDAQWNPITLPVEGATVTIDGEATAFKTDAEGKVTLKLEKAGDLVISAVSETQVLVPPVCKVNVAQAVADDNTATQTPPTEEPSGGCAGALGASTMVMAVSVLAVAGLVRKKDDEK